MKISFGLLLILGLPASALAAPNFDKNSPDCEIPIFHWSGETMTKGNISAHIKKRTVGAWEATRDKWDPYSGNGDLAGKGLYFEADPFSSQSYGNHLFIAYVKPRSALIDLRSLGMLDDPDTAHSVEALVRSKPAAFLHRWVSQLGASDALSINLSANGRLDDLPFNISKSEFVNVKEDPEVKAWSAHQAATSGEALGSMLQKYSDRLRDLYPIWNSESEIPSDESIWLAARSELSEDLKSNVGDYSLDRSGEHWEPLDSCGEMDQAELAKATAQFAKAALLPPNAHPASACELKSALIEKFKSGKGFKKFASVHAYLFQFKKALGMKADPLAPEVGLSTFSATCR